jgi:archaellum component FlaC
MVHSEVVEADAGAEPGRRPRAWMGEAQLGGTSMAKEPDNLVLKMLREIRTRLDKHEERFDRMEKRFDTIDKKLDDMSESLTYSLGLSLHANVRHESVQKQLDAMEQRIRRLEERV